MQAYLNDPVLKDSILKQIQAHYDADEIIKGRYWQNGKGCAIGCILHEPGGAHYKFKSQLGLPVTLAGVIDGIFEGLPNHEAKEWPLRVMSQFKVGKDYSKVWWLFAKYLLTTLHKFTDTRDEWWMIEKAINRCTQLANSETPDSFVKSVLYGTSITNCVHMIAETFYSYYDYDYCTGRIVRNAFNYVGYIVGDESRDIFCILAADKLIGLINDVL